MNDDAQAAAATPGRGGTGHRRTQSSTSSSTKKKKKQKALCTSTPQARQKQKPETRDGDKTAATCPTAPERGHRSCISALPVLQCSGSASDVRILAAYRALLETDGVPNLAMREALRRAHLTPAQALRKLIVHYGIPEENDAAAVHEQDRCTTRGLVWKALLGVSCVSADLYAASVRLASASSAVKSKIEGDVDRTFAHDDDFQRVVPSEALTRILNAFACDIVGLLQTTTSQRSTAHRIT